MQTSLPGFPIDYNAEIEDVYISVAQALIKSSGSLELLGCVDTRDTFHLPGQDILPSWVPDWKGMSSFGAIYNFQACKDFARHRFTEINSTRLQVEGRIIDHVYQAENPADFKILAKCEQNWFGAQAYLQEIPETNYTLPKQFEALLVRTIIAGHFQTYRRHLGTNPEQRPNILLHNSTAEVSEVGVRDLWSEVANACYRRNIFALERYTIGLGPQNTEPGDVICIIHGSEVPIVLRQEGDKWRVVGSCFIDGIMFGEAVTWTEDEADIFELI